MNPITYCLFGAYSVTSDIMMSGNHHCFVTHEWWTRMQTNICVWIQCLTNTFDRSYISDQRGNISGKFKRALKCFFRSLYSGGFWRLAYQKVFCKLCKKKKLKTLFIIFSLSVKKMSLLWLVHLITPFWCSRWPVL